MDARCAGMGIKLAMFHARWDLQVLNSISVGGISVFPLLVILSIFLVTYLHSLRFICSHLEPFLYWGCCALV